MGQSYFIWKNKAYFFSKISYIWNQKLFLKFQSTVKKGFCNTQIAIHYNFCKLNVSYKANRFSSLLNKIIREGKAGIQIICNNATLI